MSNRPADETPDLIERAAIAALTAFEDVRPESGATEWALFRQERPNPDSPLSGWEIYCGDEIACWTRVAKAVLAVQADETARLTAERDDALAGCNHWRNDYTELQGALTTKNTEIARLTAERDAAWRAGAEAAREVRLRRLRGDLPAA